MRSLTGYLAWRLVHSLSRRFTSPFWEEGVRSRQFGVSPLKRCTARAACGKLTMVGLLCARKKELESDGLNSRGRRV